MELRHLRYFVAVAEHGSLTVAAQHLHTVQPSLSRQIRDLEDEVGTRLLERSVRGIALTPAGRAFLDHARLVLGQATAAIDAARRAAQPARPTFTMGFLTGQEVDWLPHATRVIQDELPAIEVRVVSNYSPQLADDLQHGRLDVAFLRREDRTDLRYIVVATEPLVVVLPSDHRLAARRAIDPSALAGEPLLNMSPTAPVLRRVIDAYLRRTKLRMSPAPDVDNLAMAISMVASTRGVALLPEYARNFLPWSVTSRPLIGKPPVIELAIGYHRGNASPVLRTFISRVDRVIAEFEAERAARARSPDDPR